MIVEAVSFDEKTVTPLERVNQLNTLANQCRWWNEPIFADERKYLPVMPEGDEVKEVQVKITKTATEVKEAVKEVANDVLPKDVMTPLNQEIKVIDALIIGGAIFLLYKLIA